MINPLQQYYILNSRKYSTTPPWRLGIVIQMWLLMISEIVSTTILFNLLNNEKNTKHGPHVCYTDNVDNGDSTFIRPVRVWYSGNTVTRAFDRRRHFRE